jgi:hypothetical protein
MKCSSGFKAVEKKIIAQTFFSNAWRNCDGAFQTQKATKALPFHGPLTFVASCAFDDDLRGYPQRIDHISVFVV